MTLLFNWIKETDKSSYSLEGYILADKETKILRRTICNDCKSRKGFLCGECGCIIRGKTAITNHSCPLGKW